MSESNVSELPETDPNARMALALYRLNLAASSYSAAFVESLCDELHEPEPQPHAESCRVPGARLRLTR